MGAFVPLMENGGNGEHRPWMFDNTNQTLDIYRTFVNIHMEMVRDLPLITHWCHGSLSLSLQGVM